MSITIAPIGKAVISGLVGSFLPPAYELRHSISNERTYHGLVMYSKLSEYQTLE
jgi:hypothetical protein